MEFEGISGRSDFFPIAPRKTADTGLSRGFLLSLIIKTFYYRQEMLGVDLARELCLPFSVIDECVQFMRREKLVEVASSATTTSATYLYKISEAGRQRAREALEISQYVGPAPVTLEAYIDGILAQTSVLSDLNHEILRDSLSNLILPAELLERVGPALEGKRALFLYGDPGNGKTALAEGIGKALGGSLLIPHAVEIDGQVIKLMDPIFHGCDDFDPGTVLDQLSENVHDDAFDLDSYGEGSVFDDTVATGGSDRFDERWVEVQRPVVFAGGELTLEMLDLTFNSREGFYEAPLHMKANGGVFIIDDFGRQLVSPRDLLNRWIVPLDKGIDFLTLHTGRKFPIPFRAMVIFATNLKPRDLADEAFLRRIRYKIEILDPTREQFTQIFWQECARNGIAPNQTALDYMFDAYYHRLGIAPRCCHPRDMLQKLVESAAWQGVEPVMSEEALDRVCSSYFLSEDMRVPPDEPAG